MVLQKFFAAILKIPRQIGWERTALLDRVGSTNRYALRSGELIHLKGWFNQERVALAEIESWTSSPEMTFDVVCLKLTDGNSRQWLDRYGDLLAILRNALPAKEKPTQE